MKAVVIRTTRRGGALALERLRVLRARRSAAAVLGAYLGDAEGHERVRLLAAIGDLVHDHLAEAEGPLSTACRLYAKGGRLAPSMRTIRNNQRAEAEAHFTEGSAS